VKGESLVVKQLGHFTLYEIEVKACRKKVAKDEYPECGGTGIANVRTKKNGTLILFQCD